MKMFSSVFGGGAARSDGSNNTPNVGDSKASTNDAKQDEINPNFICPITGDIMTDPVVDYEGESPFTC